MDAAARLDDIAHVPDFELEGGVFETGLHLAPAEPAQVAAPLVRRAVGPFLGERLEGVGLGGVVQPRDQGLQLVRGLLLGYGDVLGPVRSRSSRVPVLDEDVQTPDTHWMRFQVLVQLVLIRTFGLLPLRVLGVRVEEVLSLLGLAVPDGPRRGQASARCCCVGWHCCVVVVPW